MRNRLHYASGSVLLLYALAALAIMAVIGTAVYQVKQWGYNEAKAECEAAAKAQRDKEAKAIEKATTKLEARNEKTRTVYRTITKEVDKLVVEYRDRPCLDPAGLRLANCAIRGQDATACKPDDALPGAGATVGRDR